MVFDPCLDRDFFPPLEAEKSGILPRETGVEIYWEISGNPKGIPVLYLHGGPGAGLSPIQRRFFDPEAFRVLLFDQRGAGRSRPHALQMNDLNNNTTSALIADMEALRKYMGVERWLLMGGSWGSTLAFAYAQSHPERCLGLIIRGFFAGTDVEIEHFLTVLGDQYPEAQQSFLNIIGLGLEDKLSSEEILTRYWKAFHDDERREAAIKAWTRYEFSCASLRYQPQELNIPFSVASSIAILEAHYMRHSCFLEPDQLFLNMLRIRHLPIFIAQGRHDRICPPKFAWRFAKENPNISLRIVEAAAHSVSDMPLRVAAVGATESMKQILK